jgi:hypothetical protein
MTDAPALQAEADSLDAAVRGFSVIGTDMARPFRQTLPGLG